MRGDEALICDTGAAFRILRGIRRSQLPIVRALCDGLSPGTLPQLIGGSGWASVAEERLFWADPLSDLRTTARLLLGELSRRESAPAATGCTSIDVKIAHPVFLTHPRQNLIH